MDKDDIIKMAKEAGLAHFHDSEGHCTGITDAVLVDADKERDDERLVQMLMPFAALVAAAERERVAAWMMERGYATGHGDTIEDLLNELDWQIREQEREACTKVPQEFVCSTGFCRFTLTQTNVGIGERGMQAYEEAKKRGWVGISEEQPSEQGVSNDQRT